MAKTILPKTLTNDIEGLAVWADKDQYPEILVGSTDPTIAATDTGSINGNWVRIRNYVNSLRMLIDNYSVTIADATDTVAGKVTIAAQNFAGLKNFFSSITLGKASTNSGFLNFFNAANAFYAQILSSTFTANRTITIPDKTGTLALTSDITGKQDSIVSTDNLQFNRSDVITHRIRNSSGSKIDMIVPAGTFSDRSITLPAISGTVMIKPTSLFAPFNARISSITIPEIDDVSLSLIKFHSNKVNVLLKWCLEGMSGVGDNVNHFTFDVTPAFDLTGYYIYFPQYSRNLKIASISGAVATLSSDEGLPLTIGNANTGDLPFVHCNALKYVIVVIPYNPNTASLDYSQLKKYDQEYKANGITSTQITLELQMGARYNIMVWAVTADVYSTVSTVPLQAGLYPLISFGAISETGASLVATPTRAGFTLNISGLADADWYQICYTADGNADFSNVNHQILESRSKSIDISVSDSRSYSVKMRPMIGSQVVGSVYSAKVVSGAGGALPTDQCILTIPVSIRTYTGTMTYNSGTGITVLSVIKTPSGGTQSVGKLTDKMEGSIIKDSAGKEFLLAECVDDSNYILKNIGSNAFTPTTGTFEINTTKRGRMAYYGELNKIDYDITLVVFDCDLQVRYNSVMRWYQYANESAYDSIGSINASDKEFKKDTDLKVYSSNDVSNGTRIFVIDFFDAGGSPENRGGVTGTVSVFGRPRSKTGVTVVA